MDLYASPGPSAPLEVSLVIEALLLLVPSYGSIDPTEPFSQPLIATSDWFYEAGQMHSMENVYFARATGNAKPPVLPNTQTGCEPGRAPPWPEADR